MIYSRAHILALLADLEHSICLHVFNDTHVKTDCSSLRDFEALVNLAKNSRNLYVMAYITVFSHYEEGFKPVYLNIETGEVM